MKRFACMLSVLVAIVPGLPAFASAPPAGQLIENEAQVSYQDTTTGVVSRLKSNLVRVAVDPQEALLLTQDQSVGSGPGSPVVFVHRLTNTGNVTSTYALSAANLTGDAFDLQQVTIYRDINSNGFLDPGEPLIPSMGTVVLAPQETAGLVVTALVPPTVAAGQSAQLRFSATSSLQSVTASNTDSVTTTNDASVQLSKSASNLAPRRNDEVTFTLTAVNSGNSDAGAVSAVVDGAPASYLIIRDELPANTTFSGMVSSPGAVRLYHVRGMPAAEYSTSAPADLTQLDAVAFGFPGLVVGQATSASFKVRINDNASGSVFNTAQALYHDNGANRTSSSNRVELAVPVAPPTIRFYTDANYTKFAVLGRLGSPVFVQANAAACNLSSVAAETHTILISSDKTGDSEAFTAIETGPNTGIFRIVPQALTADAATSPVAAGDGVISARRNDVLAATITGCGPNAGSATLLLDPAGVVFDSRTNLPLAGATLTLIDVSGNGNGGKPGELATVLAADGTSPAPSTVTTDADGRFQFPLVAPSTYRLVVTPTNGYTFPSARSMSLLPAGRIINMPGSFGGDFQVSAETGTVLLDVPLDPAAAGGLFLEKRASRGYAEVGDFIDYTLTIKNQTGYTLSTVSVHDRLPVGFTYQAGSTRLDKAVVADPTGGKGPDLAFELGTISVGTQLSLTYRVLVGPGAMQGDGINRAQATSDRADSNTASARVLIQGGVFSDRGFITGKVFADCNDDGLQNNGEVGIPGIRLYLDDGTFVVTDSEGKYSLYGVSPRLHVLRFDQPTLPLGARPSFLFNRDAGDGGTRFVDLKAGELFRADFPLSACTPALRAEVARRRQNAESSESERILKAQFLPERLVKSEAETKSLPASGVIGANLLPPNSRTAAVPANAASAAVPAGPVPAVAGGTAEALAAAAPADNTLEFLDFKDQDVLPFAQANIRVKGPSESTLRLKVNDAVAPLNRVGKKTVYAAKQAAVWEYIGIALKPGSNEVTLTEVDPFGNARALSRIHLIAPNKLGKLRLELPHVSASADGKTPVLVKVQLTDATGIPVTVRTPVTLEAGLGSWQVPDADDKERGLQVFVEGGQGVFALLPPQEPGETTIHAFSGPYSAEAKLSFLPELRPFIALGSTEQVFSFSRQSGGSRLLSGFESELDRLSVSSASGGFKFASHTGLLMKGKVKGNSLLTLAYDSEKSKNERLFRDIQPDDFYPVYGDSSVRGYEAQSTNPFYFRLDHGSSYLLWGDYATQDTNNPARVISNYSRSLTGVRQHFETERFSFTGFGSHEDMQQGVEELPANGTSGPFLLSRANVRPNSERIELLTRDRHQPSVVVQVVPQTRFIDYQFDALTGNILFKAPVPSFDAALNPIFIRVTYEYEQGGPKFWVVGGEGQVKINRYLALGGVFVNDANPENRSQLRGVNTTVTLGDKTQFIAEFAQTAKDLTGTGNGFHMEFNHKGQRLETRIFAGRTDAEFENSSALLNKGLGETGARFSFRLDDKTRLLGEALYTEDVSSSRSTRAGALLGVERSFNNNIRMEFGVRHAGNPRGFVPAAGEPQPESSTNLRGKLTMQLPRLPRASVFGEYEQDVTRTDNKMFAVGASYQLFERGRVYLRHELISSLGSLYNLNPSQQQSATVIGIDANYLRDAHVFSEYRGKDAFSGRETEAAIGLRNGWRLRDGLTVNTTLENIRTLSGKAMNDSIAVTGGIEYTASPVWKGSARLEVRGSTTSNSVLSTLGITAKISQDWTFLGRGLLATTTLKGPGSGERDQHRLQFGFAYRDTESNAFTLLAMAELKSESDESVTRLATHRRVLVFSTNANYQPSNWIVLSGRYAGKLLVDGSNGLDSNSKTHLLSSRMMFDLGSRWDAGVATRSLFSHDLSQREYGLGAELGYRLMKNVWLSAGYNLLGFEDRDLAGEDATRRGAYIRLRFKFDENFLRARASGSE